VWNERAARARSLAARFPASAEVLGFYGEVAEWQARAAPAIATLEDAARAMYSLRELIERVGPEPLARSAREAAFGGGSEMLEHYWSGRASETPLDLFARAALQPIAARLPAGEPCPWCSAPPQVGALSEQGEGLALELVCPLCLRRRPATRGRCAGCAETAEPKLVTLATTEFPHLALMACETCRGYLPMVDLSKEPRAIPEVDELAGLPLDLWAHERGYRKLQPNLAGI
jgi:FdhE protein